MSFRIFAAEALADMTTTASLVPSSSHLASAMLKPLALAKARVAVEFGAGTGAITGALLNSLPAKSKLLVFEINPRFCHYLKERFSDPRLILINSSVENVAFELEQRGFDKIDAIASSLGLGLMSDRQHHTLFRKLLPLLNEGTVLTQYQYAYCMQFSNGKLRRLNLNGLLRQYFRSVKSTIVWRNLPPAFVFTCQGRVGNSATHMNHHNRRSSKSKRSPRKTELAPESA